MNVKCYATLRNNVT